MEDTKLILTLVHLIGVFLLFMGIGGMIVRSILGDKDNKQLKILCSVSHGLGLVIILIAGFGILGVAKLAFGPWVIVKLIIWLIFGAVIIVINRKPELGKIIWFLLLILAATAGYLGLQPHASKIAADPSAESQSE